jgi:hypothetical protein
MQAPYQARRISKRRADELQRSGDIVNRALVLDTYNGFLVIEPMGANLGVGAPLSPEEVDDELQPVWHLGPRSRLREARRLLGLDAAAAVGEMSPAGA